ncbi:conjugal transfer protein TraH [Limnohabitans sp.]|jgi:conjugative transfer pilus assembly protein TraH|uniref:conjugal transfer protein TraH n=1 Tax=Limnohabitans sp. TaxID=1907725 RepID=UPI003918D22E
MKKLRKISVATVAALSFGAVGANGLSGLLEGMFTNVTAPDVVSNQMRGAITGGSVYVRSPMSNIQVMSLDPPRLSAGCGGIDLYLGSFSFITAEKLTQFIRSVAQNAAPLAFKMAIDASFPQLGGVLDKFQHMAQMMNDSQRNSCQLSKGLLDGSKNPEEIFNNLSKSLSGGVASVRGWVSDFTEALTSDQSSPSKNIARARSVTTSDGRRAVPNLGNITWNALNSRKQNGLQYAIADDPFMGQQLILSMLGTQVNKEATSDSAEPRSVSFPPQRVRLKDLFRPATGRSGIKEVPIWSCSTDPSDCLSPSTSVMSTSGVEGFVRLKMYGSETASTALPGSIIHKMANCTSGACSLSSSQLQFLNSLGKVPAVGLMVRSQSVPSAIGIIAPNLLDMMTDELSVLYGRSVLNMALSAYSDTDLPKPEGFYETIKQMMADIDEVERSTRANVEQINKIAAFIDNAIRTNGSVLRYRAR